jgi:hypothetical protein
MLPTSVYVKFITYIERHISHHTCGIIVLSYVTCLCTTVLCHYQCYMCYVKMGRNLICKNEFKRYKDGGQHLVA